MGGVARRHQGRMGKRCEMQRSVQVVVWPQKEEGGIYWLAEEHRGVEEGGRARAASRGARFRGRFRGRGAVSELIATRDHSRLEYRLRLRTGPRALTCSTRAGRCTWFCRAECACLAGHSRC